MKPKIISIPGTKFKLEMTVGEMLFGNGRSLQGIGLHPVNFQGAAHKGRDGHVFISLGKANSKVTK